MRRDATLRSDEAHWRQDRFLLAIICLTGFGLRVVVSWQSPNYDELYSIQQYIRGPWSAVLWEKYSPNNHVLFTVIAKLIYEVTGSADPQLMRLPAELAGIWAAWLLAKPFWPAQRGTALLIAAAGILYPWLLAFSCDARGYSLMLALAILATLYLSEAQSRFSWRYILAVTGAVMAVPIAVAPLIGHGILSLLRGRSATLRWTLSAACALVLSGLLYLPQLRGISQYWGGLHNTGEGFPVLQLLPYVGWHLVLGLSAGAGILGWLMLVLALAPAALAWRLGIGREIVGTCAVAVGLALIGAVLIPGGGQIRYLIWLIPMVILGMAAVARWLLRNRDAQRARVMAIAVLLIGAALAVPVIRAPLQPMEDAVRAGYARSQQDRRLFIGVGIGSFEAIQQFGQLDGVAYDLMQLRSAESAARGKIRVAVFYSDRLARYNQDVWQHLESEYRVEDDLRGRMSDCLVLSR